MAETTNIEWCDATFNPWIGCTKVSVVSAGGGGCDHCYAEVSTPARVKRAAGVETWGPRGQRQRTSAHNWQQPLAWERDAAAFMAQHGRRRRVFCASLADVFDNAVEESWRLDLFWLIHKTPNLDWLLLTKRIGNARSMLHEAIVQLDPAGDWPVPLPNVWLGATVVNQAEADRDIRKLLDTPAAVRFLSIEPMLGPIDLQRPCTACCANKGTCFADSSGQRLVVDSESGGYLMECICSRLNGLHWVICGGESGHRARPMHPDWARSLRDQCAAAGVPFLFKQWGEWAPGIEVDILHAGTKDGSMYGGKFMSITASGRAPKHGDRAHMLERQGKKAAGRLLDGVEHNGFPEVG